MPVQLPKTEIMFEDARYDRIDNKVLQEAIKVVYKLFDWFATYDADSPVHPNVRFNAGFVAVCLGDESLWNTEENNEDQLNMEWILKEYKNLMLERVGSVEDWEEDRRSNAV